MDVQKLAINVLLYDRLVVPVYTPQKGRDEREHWVKKGWDPDLQEERLSQLGDLAVHRPWNERRRELFKARSSQIDAEQHDADLKAKHETRMLLAQEKVVEKPPGVHGVTVIAAYNSTAAAQTDFPVTDAKDHLSAQGYLLSRRLAVPDLPDAVVLKKAIALSRDPKFYRKRSFLFDWQLDAINKKWSPQETVERIVEHVDDYNQLVTEAAGAVKWRFAFTLFAGTLGFFTGGPLGAGVGAAISLAQFAKLDRKPTVSAGAAQPVVMFHDIETKVGHKLT